MTSLLLLLLAVASADTDTDTDSGSDTAGTWQSASERAGEGGGCNEAGAVSVGLGALLLAALGGRRR